MVGFDGGYGATTNINSKLKVNGNTISDDTLDSQFLSAAAHFGILVGPAIGVKLGKVVRFDATAGLYVMCLQGYEINDGAQNSNRTFTWFTTSGVGFGAEVQAKFFPDAVVSPLVGYRYNCAFSDSFYTIVKAPGAGRYSTYSSADSVIIGAGTVYVGVSINW